MELNPLEGIEGHHHAEAASRLQAFVAISVALLATFMALCHVKDDNVLQGMQQARAQKIDDWGFYQARNLRHEIALATQTQLSLDVLSAAAENKQAYTEAIAKYKTLAEEQDSKKEAVKKQAEADDVKYEVLEVFHHRFDLAEAFASIGIALLALSALTHKRWLFAIALFPAGVSVVFGLWGLITAMAAG